MVLNRNIILITEIFTVGYGDKKVKRSARRNEYVHGAVELNIKLRGIGIDMGAIADQMGNAPVSLIEFLTYFEEIGNRETHLMNMEQEMGRPRYLDHGMYAPHHEAVTIKLDLEVL